MISVRDLTIGYDGIPLMRNLTFAVRRSACFAILGGSGAGKSTLLRHLVGLEFPISGSIEIDGIGAPTLAGGIPQFGVLFQSGALLGSMTLAQNVALPLRRWTDLDEDAIEVVIRSKLRLVGLECFENHLPSQVSGGMRKRAGIARALALEPPLLFLDEPSAGLDPVTAVELDDLIGTLTGELGVTTVVVTHELPSIFRIADDCILLDKEAQGIVARGRPQDLRDRSEDERVMRFFQRRPRFDLVGERESGDGT